MIRRIWLAIGLASLCFTVSAKPAPLPVPLAQDLPVEVVLNQHELAVEVPATAAAVGMQFGLIGALVGSAVQNAQVKKAEERVVPIRNALLDYKFNERVEAALRAKLASEGLSPNPVIKIMATPWDAVDAQQSKQDMPLHAMVIVPSYAIDYDFNTLSVSLLAQLVDRTVKPNGKVKTKFLVSRNYAFRFPLAGALGDDNPQRWAGMGAERLGALLDQGVNQAADMLVHDFSPAGRADREQKIKKESATVKGMTYPGHAVRQTDEWVWVRTGNGMFATLQGYQPTDPGVMPAASTETAATANASVPVAPAAATPAAPASAPQTGGK
ncbi:hypothetical protein [Lysobacter tyrosinilyticus]